MPEVIELLYTLEVSNLSLEKYLAELIPALVEGFVKCKTTGDVVCAAEVLSALHQRFGAEFTSLLSYHVARGMVTPPKNFYQSMQPEQKEKEESVRVSRQRVLLRVATELWLIGLLRNLADASQNVQSIAGKGAKKEVNRPDKTSNNVDVNQLPLPLAVLKEMLNFDQDFVNLPIVVTFVKTFAQDILGQKPQVVEQDIVDISETNNLVSVEEKEDFNKLIRRYFQHLKNYVLRKHRQLRDQEKRNNEAYTKSGEIFEDRQAAYMKLLKAHEKLQSNAQAIADHLNEELPSYEDEVAAPAGSVVISSNSLTNRGDDEDHVAGIWDNEDERCFYEETIDLKLMVPPTLLGDLGSIAAMNPNNNPAEPAAEAINQDTLDDVSDKSDDDDDDDVEGLKGMSSSASHSGQIETFLIRLPTLHNRELIDQTAVDFCFINSKSSRNRFIKALLTVARNRQDLLPYYARLVATLNRYIPEIGAKIVSGLVKEFRRLQRIKEKDMAESRVRNIWFLGELTKFKVTPRHVVFYCFKTAIDNFNRFNILIIATLLEKCGRFLYRNPSTTSQMQEVLETLNRKRSANPLATQEHMLIENALYYCNPPERPAIVPKNRSPEELYLRKLIYADLNKKSAPFVLRQLRKFDWQTPETQLMMLKNFSKVWAVKNSNIPLLAVLVGGLAFYHPEFPVSLVDNLFEQVRVGLEKNYFEYNQARIAQIKYLGELYNYKFIDTVSILELLYLLVTYGHENGRPMPKVVCPIDSLNDFFRARLVCTLLDTAGHCFDKGIARKRLDLFLALFQYYLLTKEKPPLDITYMVQDIFNQLRPAQKIHDDVIIAAKAFHELALQITQTVENMGEEDPESEDESTDGDDDLDGLAAEDEDSDLEERTDSENISSSTDFDDDPNDDDDDEKVVLLDRKEEEILDEDFDRDFALLMSETPDTRKIEKRPVFDVPLPTKYASTTLSDRQKSSELAPAGMAFSLLTKKGNKQQMLRLDVPLNSHLALTARDKQLAKKEEQMRIKSLVLNYEQSEQNENVKVPPDNRLRSDRDRRLIRQKGSTPSFSDGF